MTDKVENVIISLENINAVLSYLGKRPAEEVLGLINTIHSNVVPHNKELAMSHFLTELRHHLNAFEGEAKEEIHKFLDAMHIKLNLPVDPVVAPPAPIGDATPEPTFTAPTVAAAGSAAPVCAPVATPAPAADATPAPVADATPAATVPAADPAPAPVAAAVAAVGTCAPAAAPAAPTTGA
jgi:hypothetical protein